LLNNGQRHLVYIDVLSWQITGQELWVHLNI
jgi:hypothetical protein